MSRTSRSKSSFEIKVFEPGLADDLAELFATGKSANFCWCMWFITSVKDHHAAGPKGNRAKFEALSRTEAEPMGLLAYQNGEAVAWCAVGPKDRYERAVHTPTMKGAPQSAEPTWFVPCFFVRNDMRRTGVTKELLKHAAILAAAHGAKLIQGFPASGNRPASGGDRQVGAESVFVEVGFAPVHRPSTKRVVMQLQVRESR